MKLSISNKIYLLVTLIITLELCFVGMLLFTQKQLEDSFAKEIEARKIANAVNEVLANSIKAGTYGVLTFVAKDKLLAKESTQRLQRIVDSQQKLLNLKGLSEKERKILEEMMASVKNFYKLYCAESATNILEDKAALLNLHMNFENLISQADSLLNLVSLTQDSQIKEQEILRNRIYSLVITGILLNIVSAYFFAALLNRNLGMRSKLLLDNFNRLEKNQTLLPPNPASDEIGKLDIRFHEVAGLLKKTIEREQAILKNTKDIILSLDSLLEIQFINSACFDALGHTPEDLIGKEIDIFLDKEEVTNIRKSLLQCQKEQSTSKLELNLVHKNGTIKNYLLTSTFSSEEGLMFCVLRDVTEEKLLEKKKRDFISMVSHDMRSPLTALKVTLGLIEEGSISQKDPQGKQVVTESRDELDRLVRLVDDLLESEKLELAQLDIKKETIAFEKLVESSLNAVKSLSEEKNISVSIQTSQGSLSLFCDPDRTIQILTNLIGNAIKYSPEGSSIQLSGQEIKSWTEISVKDEGPGLKEDEINQVFEQFQQLDSPRKEGSGLGLYIARKLVEAQEGVIGVDSKEGSGSRFWFRLPANR